MKEKRKDYAWQQQLEKKVRLTVNVQGRVDIKNLAGVARALRKDDPNAFRTMSELFRILVDITHDSMAQHWKGFEPFETSDDAIKYLSSQRLINETKNRELYRQLSSVVRLEEYQREDMGLGQRGTRGIWEEPADNLFVTHLKRLERQGYEIDWNAEPPRAVRDADGNDIELTKLPDAPVTERDGEYRDDAMKRQIAELQQKAREQGGFRREEDM